MAPQGGPHDHLISGVDELVVLEAWIVELAPERLRDPPQSVRPFRPLSTQGSSAHDPEIREFEITSGGIALGDPIGDEHVLG